MYNRHVVNCEDDRSAGRGDAIQLALSVVHELFYKDNEAGIYSRNTANPEMFKLGSKRVPIAHDIDGDGCVARSGEKQWGKTTYMNSRTKSRSGSISRLLSPGKRCQRPEC